VAGTTAAARTPTGGRTIARTSSTCSGSTLTLLARICGIPRHTRSGRGHDRSRPASHVAHRPDHAPTAAICARDLGLYEGVHLQSILLAGHPYHCSFQTRSSYGSPAASSGCGQVRHITSLADRERWPGHLRLPIRVKHRRIGKRRWNIGSEPCADRLGRVFPQSSNEPEAMSEVERQ
jgi:hypothetical protein